MQPIRPARPPRGAATPPGTTRGRGAVAQTPGRFAATIADPVDDGWRGGDGDADIGIDLDADADIGELGVARREPRQPQPEPQQEGIAARPTLATEVREERARRVISRNTSPDIGFGQSVNPYRGCEHGCVYCFARPSHSYLDLSPGLDFETRLYAKTNAAACLRAEFAKPGYACAPIALGINTDAYQPIERRWRVTRSLLEVMADCRHPVSLLTKSALVERDIDLLAPMAARGLATVHFSITTLDNRLAARMEPRAAAPHARLRAMRRLAEAGIPVGVMVAPVVPAINDAEIEAILAAAHDAGARAAGYVLLRLPHELKTVWREWLAAHYPERAAHAMSLLRQMRGGRDYDARFGTRQRGEGPFADLIAQRFRRAHRALGYGRLPALDSAQFARPRAASPQRELF